MKRAKFWYVLAAVWLIACEAVRRFWAGWPGAPLEGRAMLGRGNGDLRSGRAAWSGDQATTWRGRAPNEPAPPGRPLAAGTPHPSLPHKGGGDHISPHLWGRIMARRWVQTPARDALGTQRAGVPAGRPPPAERHRPAETPAPLRCRCRLPGPPAAA